MNNFFSLCNSNDIVFATTKKYDRFRIMLGSGYSYRLGKTKKINTCVKFVYKGSYYPQEFLDTLSDGMSGISFEEATVVGDAIGDNIDNLIELAPTGPVFNPFIGVGVQSGVFQFNPPGTYIPPVVPTQDGGGYFDWNVPPIRQDFVYFGGPQINVTPQSGGGLPNILNDGGGIGVLEFGQGVVDVPQPNVNESIVDSPPIGNNNSQHFIYLPPYELDVNGDDKYSVGLSFNPVVEVEKVVKDFSDWTAYRCRLYIPEFVALLQASGVTAEKYLTFQPTLDGFQYEKFVGYILGIQGVLDSQIKESKLFKHYSFKYDLPLNFGQDIPTRNIVVDGTYNYYNPEFEKRVGEINETSITNFYDVFSTKSFDSRSPSCPYRSKTVCLDRLVGTERNLLYIADDLDEVSLVNSLTEENHLVPFGVKLEFPVRYSRINTVLKNNSLLTRMSLDVFDGAATNKSDFSDMEAAVITNSMRDIITNVNFFDVSQWMEGVYKSKFGSFDFSELPVSIYDFGNSGKNISINIDNDLSVESKSLLAAQAIEDLAEYTQKNILDFWNVSTERSSRFGYYVDKRNNNFNIQRFLAVTSNNFESSLNIFDMQAIYDKRYTYVVDSIESFVSSEYYYSKDIGGKFLDLVDGSLYFTLFVKNKIGCVSVPQITKDVKIVDSFPISPEVSVEQYRDNLHKCLFMLNSGIGEEKGKFVALNDSDVAMFNEYKNQRDEEMVDGLVHFKSDDPAKMFEVYYCGFAPSSYLDFKRISVIDNEIKINNNNVVLSSNAFVVSLDDEKFHYLFFRQIDVHGKPSNPSGIFKIKFDNFGDRSVMSSEVFTADEIFGAGKIIKNVKNLRRYIFAKPKESVIKSNDFWEKEYRFKLLSKKTFKESNIDVKFVVRNDGVHPNY